MLPQRRGAVSAREEQREVPILRMLLFFFSRRDFCGISVISICLFGAQGCGGAALGGKGWQHEGFRSVSNGLGFGYCICG